jgi:hypothetical protein
VACLEPLKEVHILHLSDYGIGQTAHEVDAACAHVLCEEVADRGCVYLEEEGEGVLIDFGRVFPDRLGDDFL